MSEEKEVLYTCESCDTPIYEDEKYYRWADDVVTCKNCPPDDKEKP